MTVRYSMKIVLFICFLLFMSHACNPDPECELTGICASGKWQVSGFGKLKNCQKKERKVLRGPLGNIKSLV